MDDEVQKIITEQLKHLPEDVATAIISVEYQAKLQELIKRQRLLIDQAGKLEMETTLVMIGLEPLADFTENIQRELDIPTVRAKEIAMDVNEHIFKPVRDSLQAMDKALMDGEDEDEIKKPTINEKQEDFNTRLTNSNDINLNRDQILGEIENPASINGGARSMSFVKAPVTANTNSTSTEIEIRPAQEIKTIPGETVKNIVAEAPVAKVNILESKLTGPTTFSQQVVDVKPETKLPEVKKRPTSGVDPYREPLI